MRATEIENCVLCGERGRVLYRDMSDRVYSAGSWNIAQCPAAGCGLLWLTPMPVAEDLHEAYASYYTHVPDRLRAGLLDPLVAAAKAAMSQTGTDTRLLRGSGSLEFCLGSTRAGRANSTSR
jgi:hypothetical protein